MADRMYFILDGRMKNPEYWPHSLTRGFLKEFKFRIYNASFSIFFTSINIIFSQNSSTTTTLSGTHLMGNLEGASAVNFTNSYTEQ
ncbi:uncharacterized protein CLUP02_17466 [Colletotrichum lupini]|uniref:Uncharacterized protein n=1 Tax=Colletotrichum lupini TaxID=145971 RepID=A0A9Q8SEK3_9PEZI|nr:uncharacterized protein CLUP02_17466 [Colletotrichum lupini]UQC75957.1 hypothetical protein CLUP02_17466 [Colletotrichum lupini]